MKSHRRSKIRGQQKQTKRSKSRKVHSKRYPSLRGGSSKCNPQSIDPFTQNKFAEIPKSRHIRIATFNEATGRTYYQCFDAIELNRWIEMNPRNPLTNEPFSETQLRKIRKKLRKIERESEENREVFRPKGTFIAIPGAELDFTKFKEYF